MTDGTDTEKRGDLLGSYLKSVRAGTTMTLRDVEDATNKEVSNAYLSQLENGKIAKPSPNVLHALASVYQVPYERLMERAGYITPNATRTDDSKHGRAATFAIDNLTIEEEKALLNYLTFIRTQQR